MPFINQLLVYAIPLLFAIIFHEVAHGWVALMFGDSTAKQLGRLSLNPVKHIDPLGTIGVPLLFLFISQFSLVFGWAKPVPVTQSNLRKPRFHMVLVSLGGPVANLLMAIFWGGLASIGIYLFNTHALQPRYLEAMISIGQAGILINIVLMVLNLIPLPPLDGGKVVSNLLPKQWAYYYDQIEPYGLLILILLLVTGILGFVLRYFVGHIYHYLSILLGL